ncbi:MAG: hypothetical protein EB141_00530 [Verrucomicrobia bacterium]|nr:hypothetical protein [Pseudomonadota bacterium]NDA65274.1 hypothetical protein [Verrucomicrobiota bacterium]NDB74129.1 hypothetical protein [Verrucomicrobiota bacterium]NDD36799.1 hypothetical protein [Verrucomicrobiota bacterium]NDE96963.1 hypothetical protein [Verrucomicrobiota bacterium]
MPYKDPHGGLTAAGRAHYKRTEGANLKPGVKNYSSASPADKKRWISWASRFYGQKNLPPMKKPNGEPTRAALTAAAWGEPVPSDERAARAIYAKANARKRELQGGEVKKKNPKAKPKPPFLKGKGKPPAKGENSPMDKKADKGKPGEKSRFDQLADKMAERGYNGKVPPQFLKK